MEKKMIYGAASLFVAAFIVSCASAPQVSRLDADAQRDLSGYWNDTDIKIACDGLIESCLQSPRVSRVLAAAKKTVPRVLVGVFNNDSDEHIDTSIISTVMESSIMETEKFDFVSGDRVRDQLRAEKQDQQTNATEKTAAGLGKELGANFLMTGSVKISTDRSPDGSTQIRAYYVTAQLTDIETNSTIWQATAPAIRKEIKRAKSRF
ncbi:MAG: penicillin-binding protein activator LpoB [Spirochaetaceae bacterium]|nr:penicillin-binding protein activator LpoB [Spirochaetaceae bacterium]